MQNALPSVAIEEGASVNESQHDLLSRARNFGEIFLSHEHMQRQISEQRHGKFRQEQRNHNINLKDLKKMPIFYMLIFQRT